MRSCFTVVALFLTTSCLRMGFDDAATLPPVKVNPGNLKVSVLHASATRLSGSCTAIGGTVTITGDASGETLCVAGGSWSIHLDFSNAPDGLLTLFIVHYDASGTYRSPPLELQLSKETSVCSDPARDAATPFAAGTGTENDPYLVCNLAQLREVDAKLDAHIRLENDIDVGDTPWSWLGKLTGTFDGNGFVVENLSYDTDTNPTGLFSEVSGTVANLGVVDINIYSYCHVGGVAGILNAGGVIRNSYATGILQSYSDAVGGLVGQNAGTIVDSFAAVEVTTTGTPELGGLVGVNDAGGIIRGSYAVGPVTAFGTEGVGGLVGGNDGAIFDSYATGAVSGNTASSAIGGLVGKNTGTVERTYAAGVVTGTSAGGLIGENTGTVTASYWDTDASGVTESQGGAGLGTAAMCERLSYQGWDFESVWSLEPELSPYPVLDWQ